MHPDLECAPVREQTLAHSRQKGSPGRLFDLVDWLFFDLAARRLDDFDPVFADGIDHSHEAVQ